MAETRQKATLGIHFLFQRNRKYDAIVGTRYPGRVAGASRVLEEENAASGELSKRTVTCGNLIFSLDCYKDLATRGRVGLLTFPRCRRSNPEALFNTKKLRDV
jgi:hypothetical protein